MRHPLLAKTTPFGWINRGVDISQAVWYNGLMTMKDRVTRESIRANFAAGAVTQRRLITKAEDSGTGYYNGYSVERLKAAEADYLRLSQATDEVLDAHMAAMRVAMSTRLDALKGVAR